MRSFWTSDRFLEALRTGALRETVPDFTGENSVFRGCLTDEGEYEGEDEDEVKDEATGGGGDGVEFVGAVKFIFSVFNSSLLF